MNNSNHHLYRQNITEDTTGAFGYTDDIALLALCPRSLLKSICIFRTFDEELLYSLILVNLSYCSIIYQRRFDKNCKQQKTSWQ